MVAIREVLREAQQASERTESWADLSNLLFHPVQGLVAKAFPTRAARAEFVRTDEYRQIRQLVSDSRARHGLVAGGTPQPAERQYIPGSTRTPDDRHGNDLGCPLHTTMLTSD